jgi:large subunit ribosomal protein L15
MPLQRRLPKFGFFSLMAEDKAEVRLYQLGKMTEGVVDLAVLKAAGIVPRTAKKAKVILRGTLERPVTLKGIGATAGARAAIEAAGGSVEA